MTALRIVCAWLRVQAWQWARDRAMARARRTLRRHDAIVAARAHGRLMQARIDLERGRARSERRLTMDPIEREAKKMARSLIMLVALAYCVGLATGAWVVMVLK